MSKNKLRKVHINNIEWNYAVSNMETRIYNPNTKQICARISGTKFYDIGVSPSAIKSYIMENLINADGSY